MSREPIYDAMGGGKRDREPGRHRPPPSHAFRRDLAELPAFAATVKACGWNGLHMRPQPRAGTLAGGGR